MKGSHLLGCLLAVFASTLAFSQGEQKFADIGDLRLQSGQTLKSCRVGYRTYGTLDASKSNAILFPTWYLGKTADLEGAFRPGAGGLVDSSEYFVISVDALGNSVSSSPSNSKEQAEAAFPNIGVGDMVESQHKLLLKLGINHLKAVMGISMGGMQTFQWVTAYPKFMDKAIPIVGTPRPSSYDLMATATGLKSLELAIKDKAYRTQIITLIADHFWLALRTPAYFVRTVPREAADQNPLAFEKAILAWDPYDMVCDSRAIHEMNAFKEFGNSEASAASAVKAKLLVISATQDHAVNPAPALSFAKALSAKVLLFDDDSGHQSVGEEAAKISKAVAEFLSD